MPELRNFSAAPIHNLLVVYQIREMAQQNGCKTFHSIQHRANVDVKTNFGNQKDLIHVSTD